MLFLNRSYWPDVEATGQLLTALCESLTPHYAVSVLAGRPNTIAGVSGGQIDWQRTTHRNGVRIDRVSHTTFRKSQLLLRGINYVSFALHARRALHSLPAPDAVVFETDPFLLAFEARRLSLATGCRLVGYLQDIYPDVAIALGKIPDLWPVRQLREKLFEVYRQCDAMIVLSRDMKRLLVDGGVTESRITVIPNWADPSLFTTPVTPSRFRTEHELHGKFVVMYSGNLGLTQRLDVFIDAAARLRDSPEFCFCFVGGGSQRDALVQRASKLQLQNVRFLDYQPLDQLADSLTSADIHLVPLAESLSSCLMPSKVYGILASGRPLLTTAPVGSELHEMTVSHRIGLTVPSVTPDEIASTLQRATQDRAGLAEMGQRSRRLAESQFTLQHSVARFQDVMDRVLSG